jgi:hypothetical protein
MKNFYLVLSLILSACGGNKHSYSGVVVEIDGEVGTTSVTMNSQRSVCEGRFIFNVDDLFEDDDCDNKPFEGVSFSVGSISFELGREASAKGEFETTRWEAVSELLFKSTEGDFFRFKSQRPHTLDADNVSLEWIDLGASRGEIPRIHVDVNSATLESIQTLVGGSSDINFSLEFVSRDGGKDWRVYETGWKIGDPNLSHDFQPYDAPMVGSSFNAFRVCYSVGKNFGQQSDSRYIKVSVCSALFDFQWPN